MTQVTGKVIAMPCTYIPQEPVEKKTNNMDNKKILLALESLVTIAIGVCAVMSTTVFLFMCF